MTLRRWWVVLLAAAWVVLPAAPAAAHATLTAASPADGRVLDAAPDALRLTFNEPVAPAPGGLRLHDATGRQVPLGAVRNDPPEVVRAAVPGTLARGSYIVTWRVTSADGHPVAGALVFSVGDPAQVDSSLVARLFAAGDSPVVAAAAAAVRWAGYLAVLLAAGGVAFLLWVAEPDDRVAVARLARAAAVGGMVAAVLAVLVQAAQVGGGFAALLRVDDLWAAVTGAVGVQSALQVAGLAVVVVALRRVAAVGGVAPVAAAAPVREGARVRAAAPVRGAPPAGGTASSGATAPVGRAAPAGADDRGAPTAATAPAGDVALLVAAPAAAIAVLALVTAGHTRTTVPAWATVTADAVHASAAAIWSGGLVALWAVLRRRRAGDDPVGAARTVAGFSQLATVAVATVVVTGVVLAWLLVRTTTALTTTGYGWTLVAKVVLAATAIALGAWNRNRLVPAIAGPAAAGDPAGRAAAWTRLRRTVRWEVVVLVVVVAATGLLTGQRPAAEAAGVTGALTVSADVGAGAQLSVTVDPNRVGYNELHLYLLDATGRPAEATDVQVRMTLPDQDIGPIVRTPTAVGPGHWLHAGRELTVPGRWRIEVVITRDRFDQQRVPITADVRP